MKSLIIVSLVSSLAFVGCGRKNEKTQDANTVVAQTKGSQAIWVTELPKGDGSKLNDLQELSKSNGDATYRASCTLEFSHEPQSGEVEVADLTDLGGRWKLESVTLFDVIDKSASNEDPAYIAGNFANGEAQVTCQNSYESGTPLQPGESGHYATADRSAYITLPYEFDADKGTISTQAALILQGRHGRAGAEMQLMAVNEVLPKRGPVPTGLSVEMHVTRLQDGHAKVRMTFTYTFSGKTVTLASEALYSPEP